MEVIVSFLDNKFSILHFGIFHFRCNHSFTNCIVLPYAIEKIKRLASIEESRRRNTQKRDGKKWSAIKCLEKMMAKNCCFLFFSNYLAPNFLPPNKQISIRRQKLWTKAHNGSTYFHIIRRTMLWNEERERKLRIKNSILIRFWKRKQFEQFSHIAKTADWRQKGPVKDTLCVNIFFSSHCDTFIQQ